MFREYVRDQKGISIRKFKFSDCTYDLFLDYRNWLHDSKGYMESTTNNRLAAIRSYMNYVSARDISLQQIAFCVSEVPAYRVPKKIGPVIDQLETLTALLSAPPNTRTGLRDKTILSVLFDTAIRVDELVRLDFSDVNLYVFDPYIHVHGKGNKERKVYFSENTLDLIKQYIKEFHYEKNTFEAYNDRHIVHKQINDAVRLWAKKYDNVQLIDVNKYLVDQSSFYDHFNHYIKPVYYALATEIVDIVNKKLGSSIKETSKIKMMQIRCKEILAPIYYRISGKRRK